MGIANFLKVVEIETKIASVFPFLIGCLYALYRFDSFSWQHTLLFFGSMLLFDLTTTAINNYIDYHKATCEEYRRDKNIIGQENLSERSVLFLILIMLAAATGLGIWLVFVTDLLVLFIGMACFAVGIFYTFGPIPLSRMPLGEVFSGVAMGFGILFLTIYVNSPHANIASITWDQQMIFFEMNLLLILEIVLISIPCMFTIANLMLANNICDLEDDVKNQRYTLPFYIGRKYATWLYNFLYFSTFLALIISILIQLLPWYALFILILIYPVYKNIQEFHRYHIKSRSFVYAVKNLVMINGAIVLFLFIPVFFLL